MEALWQLLLHLAVMAAGAFTGNRWALRRYAVGGPLDPNRLVHGAPHLWVVGSIPLVLLVAHAVFQHSTDLQWRLPFWLQFYYAPLSWALVVATMSYLFGLTTSVYYLNGHPQRRHVLAAGVLLVVAVEVYAVQISLPDPPELRGDLVSPDGIVLQTSGSTCVPASAANLARLFGLKATERQMTALCGTDVDGTSPAELVMAMRKLGFRERKVMVNEEGPDAVKPPAIVFLHGDVHATAFVRRVNGIAEVWDPQRGAMFFTPSEFHQYLRDAHAIEFRLDPGRRPQMDRLPPQASRGGLASSSAKSGRLLFPGRPP